MSKRFCSFMDVSTELGMRKLFKIWKWKHQRVTEEHCSNFLFEFESNTNRTNIS